MPAGIPRTAGERFPAVEVGVRQGHAAAAANHSRPTAAMCSGTSCGLVLAAGDTAGIYCAAAGKEALAALPQLERDAFFVQAEQFLRETATALGDQPQPLTEPNFEKLTAQYGKLLLVDSKEKLRRYARLYPTLACTKFPIRQKNGYVWLPEQPVRQSAKAASDGITLPEIRRELLLKQLQLPPEKIALEQVYPLCYEDMGFFSENGSHRKRGEDFLKEAPQLLQDYEAQHGKVLRERYSPEEWDWFRQAAD